MCGFLFNVGICPCDRIFAVLVGISWLIWLVLHKAMGGGVLPLGALVALWCFVLKQLEALHHKATQLLEVAGKENKRIASKSLCPGQFKA